MSDTPEQIPEIPTSGPEAAPKPIRLESAAVIEWLDAEGKPTNAERCLRSTAELLRFLVEKINTGIDLKTQVRITVPTVGDKDADGQTTCLHVAEGPLEEVMQRLQDSTLTPPLALFDLQRRVEFMAGHSALKGIIITAIFGDSEVGGFGYISTLSTVTAADITALGDAATNQATLFKDQMKKRDPELKFATDEEKNPIILPPRFRRG
jgi:hypothetical protein